MHECQICYEIRKCQVCPFGHSICTQCGAAECLFCKPLQYTQMQAAEDAEERAEEGIEERAEEGIEEVAREDVMGGIHRMVAIVLLLASGLVVWKMLMWVLLVPPVPQWATFSDPNPWHWVAESLAGILVLSSCAAVRRSCAH